MKLERGFITQMTKGHSWRSRQTCIMEGLEWMGNTAIYIRWHNELIITFLDVIMVFWFCRRMSLLLGDVCWTIHEKSVVFSTTNFWMIQKTKKNVSEYWGYWGEGKKGKRGRGKRGARKRQNDQNKWI